MGQRGSARSVLVLPASLCAHGGTIRRSYALPTEFHGRSCFEQHPIRTAAGPVCLAELRCWKTGRPGWRPGRPSRSAAVHLGWSASSGELVGTGGAGDPEVMMSARRGLRSHYTWSCPHRTRPVPVLLMPGGFATRTCHRCTSDQENPPVSTPHAPHLAHWSAVGATVSAVPVCCQGRPC